MQRDAIAQQRGYMEFKPSYKMSNSDSVESAIENLNYRGEFELFLIKKYGANYKDSIPN